MDLSTEKWVPTSFFIVRGRLHTGVSQEKPKEATHYFMFYYINAVISLNNSKFGYFVDRIYPIKLEIKVTTYTSRSASYLDIHTCTEIDNEGRLKKKHDKR